MDDGVKYVPWPKDPWNEIIPNLWQGGQIALNGTHPKTPHVVRATNEFDAVFSLYWRDEEGNGPDVGVPHVHHFIPDGKLNNEQLLSARMMRALVAHKIHKGEKVLVRCQAGYNRSGLVVGLALLKLGYTADTAIALIREKRSPYALHNEHFVRYIKDAEVHHE